MNTVSNDEHDKFCQDLIKFTLGNYNVVEVFAGKEVSFGKCPYFVSKEILSYLPKKELFKYQVALGIVRGCSTVGLMKIQTQEDLDNFLKEDLPKNVVKRCNFSNKNKQLFLDNMEKLREAKVESNVEFYEKEAFDYLSQWTRDEESMAKVPRIAGLRILNKQDSGLTIGKGRELVKLLTQVKCLKNLKISSELMTRTYNYYFKPLNNKGDLKKENAEGTPQFNDVQVLALDYANALVMFAQDGLNVLQRFFPNVVDFSVCASFFQNNIDEDLLNALGSRSVKKLNLDMVGSVGNFRNVENYLEKLPNLEKVGFLVDDDTGGPEVFTETLESAIYADPTRHATPRLKRLYEDEQIVIRASKRVKQPEI